MFEYVDYSYISKPVLVKQKWYKNPVPLFLPIMKYFQRELHEKNFMG